MSEVPNTQQDAARAEIDPLDALIDRVAEAIVTKLEERRKIDLIAQAVLQRIDLRSHYAGVTPASQPEAAEQPGGEPDGREN